MGWTAYHATHYKNGKVDRKAELDAYWEEGLNRGHFEVLKSAMKGGTYYAAVSPILKAEKTKDAEGNENYTYVAIPLEERRVFAAVFLTSVHGKDYYNFAYKDMTEDCGPCQIDCPNSILDLLTHTDDEWANEWRAKCRKNNAMKTSPKSLANLPIGAVIEIKCSKGNRQLIKCAPAYQFKRPFWMFVDEDKYMPKTRIPNDYLVVSMPN